MLAGGLRDAVVVTIPGRAVAAETVTATAKAEPSWHMEAAPHVAVDGFGGGVSGCAAAGWWVATFDRPRCRYRQLHAEGVHTFSTFTGPYSQTFQSTLVAVFVRFQLPLSFATPYAEVAAGGVWVLRGEERNTQCFYESGVGGGLALGIDAPSPPRSALACAAVCATPA